MLCLNACATANFNSTLPPLVTYSPQDQQQAADGLEWMENNQAPGHEVINRMMGDYGQLRGMVREGNR